MTTGLTKTMIEPRELKSIPNLLSLLRLLLIPCVLYYYLKGAVILSGILLTLSAVTDMADGYIARRFNQVTNLGKMLDPIADKLTQFCVAVCLCAAYTALIPLALVLAVKDLLMLGIGLTLLRRGKQPFAARWWGKLATSVFYVAVIIIMLFGDKLPPGLVWAISTVVILLLTYSMIRYYNMLRNELPGV